MRTKTIKLAAEFLASPHNVYETLMDSKKHSQFSGEKAVISRKVGGKFSVFGGWATGKNLELTADKKIVQSWRASDWQENVYSKVTFRLSKTKKGTKLSFIQTGVPSEMVRDITLGWKDYYWKPMKAFLTF